MMGTGFTTYISKPYLPVRRPAPLTLSCSVVQSCSRHIHVLTYPVTRLDGYADNDEYKADHLPCIRYSSARVLLSYQDEVGRPSIDHNFLFYSTGRISISVCLFVLAPGHRTKQGQLMMKMLYCTVLCMQVGVRSCLRYAKLFRHQGRAGVGERGCELAHVFIRDCRASPTRVGIHHTTPTHVYTKDYIHTHIHIGTCIHAYSCVQYEGAEEPTDMTAQLVHQG